MNRFPTQHGEGALPRSSTKKITFFFPFFGFCNERSQLEEQIDEARGAICATEESKFGEKVGKKEEKQTESVHLIASSA
jgi:hypothetical protein